MNHEEVCRIIAEGLDLERNSATCIAVKNHLATCPQCREYLASLRRTIGPYKSYDVHVPHEVHELLEQVLRDLPGK